jgi:plastocyanin
LLVNGGSADVLGYHLARPENTHDFAFYVVVIGLTVIGVITGLAATAQNYAPANDRHAPRWLPPLLLGVAMLCAGAIAVALIPRPAAASISPPTLAALPALTTSNFAFDQTEIRATVGQTVALRLENTDAATHAFAIPDLDVDVPMKSGEVSLALFRPTAPGTYTFYCNVPHHEAMRGTLIVEP